MKESRGQHVVPQFYLRHFAGKDGALACFVKSNGKLFKAAPPRIAKEQDAFSIPTQAGRDTSFDKLHNSVEEYCAPQWLRMAEGALDADVINAVWVLSANLLTRSRTLRDTVSDMNHRLIEMISAPKFTEILAKAASDPSLARFGFGSWNASEAVADIKRSAEIIYPISQTLLSEVAEFLKGLKCEFLEAPSGMNFVTSDDPVVLLKNGADYRAEGGVSSLLRESEMEVIIPLLPTLVCRWKAGCNLQHRVITAEECRTINQAIFRHAYKQVYANAEDTLASLIPQ